MVDNIPFQDRQFFRVLPMLVSYIKTDRKLTEDEIRGFVKMFPNHSAHIHEGKYDRMLDMAVKYKDDKTFAAGIKVMLSPEGRKWLAEFFDQCDKVRKKK
jgi:hypothetical protein